MKVVIPKEFMVCLAFKSVMFICTIEVPFPVTLVVFSLVYVMGSEHVYLDEDDCKLYSTFRVKNSDKKFPFYL